MFFDSFYLLSSLSSSIIFARALASANYCWIRRVSLSYSAAFRFFINLCSSSSSATFNFSITVWSLRPLLLIKLPFDKDFDYLDDLLHPFLKLDLLDLASSSPLSVSFGQLQVLCLMGNVFSSNSVKKWSSLYIALSKAPSLSVCLLWI